ncbi:FAD-dependent oxidoreductase [Teredinibacter sp. KSP-S5-2]|uniref:FAD-dependent oxidoreductase n=1 Tax=Teredinibacter sp. KSP-S5-2 TaxID=3034506 RepID=UPI002934C539|nr:FAD-dependent oxidoreductase [Teredinibacter sp. KSP-S5-2]WNO09776.1 FAD-dependent oxidoreductase [Teredinibacter sp. KSP-S5-2]
MPNNSSHQVYDLVIIGAGIHGAGVALEASKQGKTVLVLEQYGSAGNGTSSKSSKLIHGGLRYLESGQIGLVRECLQARRKLLQEHSDLVKMVPFFIPVYTNSHRRSWWIHSGLLVYSLLSSVGFSRLAKNKWHELSGLRTEQLQTVFCYYDAQTDDKALTQRIIQQAQSLGAKIEFNNQLTRAKQEDNIWLIESLQADDQVRYFQGRILVNAAGPWINQTVQKIWPKPDAIDIELVQGTHLVLNRQADPHCFYLESPIDGRGVFLLPWKGHTLLGTTEEPVSCTPENSRATDKEIHYLLQTYNHYFPQTPIDNSDILANFSGLRVLPHTEGTAHHRTRETLLLSQAFAPGCGYIGIYGGKLTSFAIEAKKVIKLIQKLS